MKKPTATRDLHDRVNALPLCARRRSALIDEWRYAEALANDIVAAERFVHEIVRRVYNLLAAAWRRAFPPRRKFRSRAMPGSLRDEA